jgi:hypothetical protein
VILSRGGAAAGEVGANVGFSLTDKEDEERGSCCWYKTPVIGVGEDAEVEVVGGVTRSFKI